MNAGFPKRLTPCILFTGAPSASSRAGALFAELQDPQYFRTVEELEAFQLRYTPGWILSLVLDPGALESYNKVLVFLLQIRWVKQVRAATVKAQLCLQLEMSFQ